MFCVQLDFTTCSVWNILQEYIWWKKKLITLLWTNCSYWRTIYDWLIEKYSVLHNHLSSNFSCQSFPSSSPEWGRGRKGDKS